MGSPYICSEKTGQYGNRKRNSAVHRRNGTGSAGPGQICGRSQKGRGPVRISPQGNP